MDKEKCPLCGSFLEVVDCKYGVEKCVNPWCGFKRGYSFSFGIDPEYLQKKKNYHELR
jgi:hypothetical protein